ncbi:MAG: DMT family transporter [Candidatus Tectomicrobia bacterium]|nr:DMT family transporter [Candidatus Tectomicrobia bacterium]
MSAVGWPEGLALISSLAYSVTLVCLRRGMRRGTPLAALLMVCASNTLTGLVLGWLQGDFARVRLGAMLLFFTSGLFSNGTGNLFQFIGIQRLGVSRASPIASITPVWSVLSAVLFLGEHAGPAVWAGAFLIVAGVFTLSEGGGGADRFRWLLQGAVLFPLIASVVYAVSPILVKKAFALQPTPMLGLAVAFATGGVSLLLARPLLPDGGAIRADREALGWFAAATLANTVASVTMWTAILGGNVSVVVPLSRVVPLWVMLWSWLFLGQLERITRRAVLAAVMVVAGGVLITLLR